jgi:hypothetical protein
MQPPSLTASSTPPVVAPDAIKVTVRSSRGDGTRAFVVEAPASGTIGDVKQLLCRPPHSMCSDTSTLVLLLKGKGAAVTRTLLHIHLKLLQSGCILHNDDAIASAAVTEGSVVTAAFLASGSPRAQMQPQSAIPAHASLAPAAHVAPSDSTPTAIYVTNCDVAGLAPSPPTSAAAAASGVVAAAKIATQAPAPAAATVQEGSRVRIEGLQAAPEMNGRMGVVCGTRIQESGRWTVEIDADGTRAACRGAFRTANLQVIHSHNFGTEWVDEDGCVWRKNVDFSRECAKGHALAPLGDCGGDGGGMRLMCRLCHSFSGVDSHEAASWLTCSVVAGCCGGYAVCCSCALLAPSAAAAVPSAGSDDFCTLVSFGVECCILWRLTFGVAGCWTALSVVDAVDVGRVAGPHDNVSVLSNVRAAVHVAQPRQRDAAAEGEGRDGAARGRCDVVYQPYMEQRVCRHA